MTDVDYIKAIKWVDTLRESWGINKKRRGESLINVLNPKAVKFVADRRTNKVRILV